jgi:hypothetical protein
MVGVADGTGELVGTAVRDGVNVTVGVSVTVGVRVALGVWVVVGVSVSDGVGVMVGGGGDPSVQAAKVINADSATASSLMHPPVLCVAAGRSAVEEKM